MKTDRTTNRKCCETCAQNVSAINEGVKGQRGSRSTWRSQERSPVRSKIWPGLKRPRLERGSIPSTGNSMCKTTEAWEAMASWGMAHVSVCLRDVEWERENDSNWGQIQKSLVCLIKFGFYFVDEGELLNNFELGRGIFTRAICVLKRSIQWQCGRHWREQSQK